MKSLLSTLLLGSLVACNGDKDTDPDPVTEIGPRNQDWDGDGVLRPDDCNDADAAVFPGAGELCNGVDDDCDAAIDEEITTVYFRDQDGDGFGLEGQAFDICFAPEGYATAAGDCDDLDASIHPSASEVCDLYEVDENCNGQSNADDPSVVDAPTWFTDDDGDGFGVGAGDIVSCYAYAGIAHLDGDCDDTRAHVNPAADEVCDALDLDEDCDGQADAQDLEGPLGEVLWFPDADSDGYGDQTVAGAYFCDGVPSGYVADGQDCDDAEVAAFPERFEDCDDGIDNDCDGAPDDCGPLPPIDLATANLMVKGASSSTLIGQTVSSADLDGDGVAELLLGAPNESFGSYYEGAVHVVPATATGVDDVDVFETALIEGADSGEALGTYLAGLPDLDGDGYDELAVGAPATSFGIGFEPTLRIFDGPLYGDTSLASATLTFVGESQDGTGASFQTGDFDGDGTRDYAVGSNSYTGSVNRVGAVRTVLGPVNGTVDLASTAYTVYGGAMNDRVGETLASLGDTDGDGADDLAVGAPLAGSEGFVYVVSGPDLVVGSGPLTDVAVATLQGVDAGEDAGSALSAGDTDGDGNMDLFVGAPGWGSGASNNVGRVYVILGPIDGTETLATADATVVGQDSNDQLGASLDASGDVSGDGGPDLLIGALMEDHGATQSGGAYLFYGPITGGTIPATDARVRMDGQSNNEWAGDSVAMVPDVDGDLKDEVLIGAPRFTDGGFTPYGGAYLILSDRL